MGVLSADERRSAALLFSDELRAGTVTLDALDRRDVRAAVRHRRRWAYPRRWVESKLYERGRRGYRDDSLEAFDAARRAVLGAAGAGPPRLLVRVDEYPNFDSLDVPAHGTDQYARFHDVMRAAAVPYLVAVQPALAHAPLDWQAAGGRLLNEDELGMVHTLRDDGIAFALHGYDHRTRTAHMPDNTELEGRSDDDLAALLDRGLAFLAAHDVRPRVLVPPYNTFAGNQWALLAERFDVVTGGPESVSRMGYHRTPLFRDGVVYQPCYEPFYGLAADLAAPVAAAVAAQQAIWITVTLHWEWELRDDFAGLRRFLATIGPFVRPWDDFLRAVDTAIADA